MKYLEKAWVRGLISFLLGGVGSEIIFISSGDPNRPRSEGTNITTLLLVVGLYIILTYYVKNSKRNTI